MTHAGLTSTTLWLMLLLGAYHGINPGMGWLFAVALGMQETKGQCCCKISCAHCIGPRVGDRYRSHNGWFPRYGATPYGPALSDCRAAGRSRDLFFGRTLSPEMGPHAGGFQRSGIMVVPDGVRTRGRFDGSARVARKRHGRGSQRDGRAQPHISRYEPSSGIARHRFPHTWLSCGDGTARVDRLSKGWIGISSQELVQLQPRSGASP